MWIDGGSLYKQGKSSRRPLPIVSELELSQRFDAPVGGTPLQGADLFRVRQQSGAAAVPAGMKRPVDIPSMESQRSKVGFVEMRQIAVQWSPGEFGFSWGLFSDKVESMLTTLRLSLCV